MCLVSMCLFKLDMFRIINFVKQAPGKYLRLQSYLFFDADLIETNCFQLVREASIQMLIFRHGSIHSSAIELEPMTHQNRKPVQYDC